MKSTRILTILLSLILLSSFLMAVDLRTTYNPFTGKLDFFQTSNFTGENITADNIDITGNLTLGEKITFAFGEIIDNLVDGWIRITGNLNVTNNLSVDGNVTANAYFSSSSFTNN